MPPGVEPPAPPPAPEPVPQYFGPAIPYQALPTALPPAHPRQVQRMERRSTALMAVGIAAFCAGVVTAAVGGLMYLNAANGNETCGTSGRCYTNQMTTGTIVVGVGAAVAAVGLPMWVIGSAKVPVRAEGRAEAGALRPTMAVGPTRVAINF